MSLLARYLSGEHRRVWEELLVAGAAVRGSPLSSDALAVARATMRRAAYNVDLLTERLPRVGWRFGDPAPRAARRPHVARRRPPADTPHCLATLERHAGPLPLAMRAWYEEVGGVDWLGSHADWPCPYPDPLFVYPIDAVMHDLDAWRDERQWYRTDDGQPFVWDIAPDYYHKANISGGPPYQIALPSPAADALVENEWHDTTFVGYLRAAFRWGGLPGLARCPRPPQADLARLTEGLLPI